MRMGGSNNTGDPLTEPGWAEPRTTARPPCSVNYPGHHTGAHATRVNHTEGGRGTSWSVHTLVDLEDRDRPLAVPKCGTGAQATRVNHKGAHATCEARTTRNQGARQAHA